MNKKVLLVVTNQEEMGASKKKTGLWLSELVHPYNAFTAQGVKIEVASVSGGKSPLSPDSIDPKDLEGQEFLKKHGGLLENTKKLSDLNPKDYSAIMFTGGHGAMWDFTNSSEISEFTRDIYEKNGIVAAVCHGPAALTNIQLSNKKYLISGKKVAGFSNAEEDAAGYSSYMPFMLESKLKERGALYTAGEMWKEHVVVDGKLVTGQNPASAHKVAVEIINLLNK